LFKFLFEPKNRAQNEGRSCVAESEGEGKKGVKKSLKETRERAPGNTVGREFGNVFWLMTGNEGESQGNSPLRLVGLVKRGIYHARVLKEGRGKFSETSGLPGKKKDKKKRQCPLARNPTRGDAC